MKKPAIFCALLATAAFILGSIHFGLSFIRPDEPLYIQIALDMAKKHAFLIPLNHGRPDFVKPPLVYWLELAAFEIFGVRIWGAKLFIWFSGLFTVFFTYRLGNEIFQDEEKAVCGALILLFNFFFFTYSQAVMMDVPLAFFVVFGTYAYAAASKNRLWLILCGFAIGLSTLVKGPVGIVLCLIPILLYALRARALNLFLTKEAGLGTAAALFSFFLWPVWLWMKGYGADWFNQFILTENFGKFGGGRMPVKILLIGLFGGIAPWTFFLVESFWKGKDKRFLIGWILGIFAVFCLPARKLPHYVMPVIPACALLIASVSEWSAISLWGTRLLLAFLGVLWLLGTRLTDSHLIQLVVAAGSVALLASAVTLKNRQSLTPCAALFGLFLLTFPVVIPAIQTPGRQNVVAVLSGRKNVGVFCPADQDPRGFEISPRFSSCRTPSEARTLLEEGGTLIFAEHEESLIRAGNLRLQMSWKVWKGGIGLGSVLKAVGTGDTSPLTEEMKAAVLAR